MAPRDRLLAAAPGHPAKLAHLLAATDIRLKSWSYLMEGPEDIKRLLGEIRDIQKAHYERYVAVTEQLLESEKRTFAENARSQHEYEANVAEAKAFREEVRRMAGMRQFHLLIGGVALLVFVIAVGGLSFLASILVRN